MPEGINPMRDAYTDITRKGASPVDGGPIHKEDLYQDDYDQTVFERALGGGVGEPIDDQDPLNRLIEKEDGSDESGEEVFEEVTPRTIDDVLEDISAMEKRQGVVLTEKRLNGIIGDSDLNVGSTSKTGESRGYDNKSWKATTSASAQYVRHKPGHKDTIK